MMRQKVIRITRRMKKIIKKIKTMTRNRKVRKMSLTSFGIGKHRHSEDRSDLNQVKIY